MSAFLLFVVFTIVFSTIEGSCPNTFPGGRTMKPLSPSKDPDPYDHKDPSNLGACVYKVDEQPNGGKVAKNFKMSDFNKSYLKRADKCGYRNNGIIRLHPKLVECVQSVRDKIGKSVNIHSGYRSKKRSDCKYGDKRVKNGCKKDCSSGCSGTKKCYREKSKHQSGTAADIKTSGISKSSTEMFKFAKAIICRCRNIFRKAGMKMGLGLYSGFIHIDMRKRDGYWLSATTVHGLTKDGWKKYISDTWSKECTSYNKGFNPLKPTEEIKNDSEDGKSEDNKNNNNNENKKPSEPTKGSSWWDRTKDWFSSWGWNRNPLSSGTGSNARVENENILYGEEDGSSSPMTPLISTFIFAVFGCVMIGFCCGGVVGMFVGWLIKEKELISVSE